MSKLTIKQEAFAKAYLETGNASEAYRQAYPNSTKWKPAALHVKASEMLSNGKVSVRIEQLQAAAQKRHEVTVDRVLAEYVKIAFVDAGDYFDWGPDGVTVRRKSDLTPEQRAVVAEVSQTVTEKGGTIRVKLHDKLNALEKLGKHLGMFKELHEHTGKDGGPIQTQELSATDRARRVAFILNSARKPNGHDAQERH
jgi:phage terminase small subunit